MLQITIPALEQWDEKKEEFISAKGQTLQLEHSLVSLSKWESKWHKAFLKKEDFTSEETLDYIKHMTITSNVDPSVYDRLTNENYKQVRDYINTPMTATILRKDNAAKGGRETVTSELIYYWMIALNIPFECQKWHLSRLLTLIEVCNLKNRPVKKRKGKDILRDNARLNEARRKQLNTRG